MEKRIVRSLALTIAWIIGMDAAWTATPGNAQSLYTEQTMRLEKALTEAGMRTETETSLRTEQAVLDWGNGAAELAQTKGPRKHDRSLPKDMSVGGLSIGGLRSNEAIAKILKRIDAVLERKVILESAQVSLGDSEEPLASVPTWRELGLTLNADEAIRSIARYRDASWLNKRSSRRSLARSYALVSFWDEERFAEMAETLWGARVEKRPIDAVRSIDPLDRVLYAPESPGTALDAASLLTAFKKRAPASLTEDDGDPLRLRLTLPVVPIQPEITTASLEAEGISRKIAEFSTSFAASGAGRVHNVTATADALNDTLLDPGDTFDYGAVVAKARRAFGYKAAPVILKGKLVPGIGGGICQVSSTLYNAIVRASDLTVVERRNHSLPVNYLPQGMDATFAEGYINFRFRNDTGKKLLIKTAVRDRRLTVKLFGTMPDNVRYELQTVREREIEPRIVYAKDAGLPLGMSRLVQEGKAGAVVDTYRLKYVNGKLAERRKLNRSTYRAQDGIVAVHPADPRAGGPNTPAPQRQTPAEPM